MRSVPLFAALFSGIAILTLPGCSDAELRNSAGGSRATDGGAVVGERESREQRIHPDFTLSRQELEAILAELPPSLQERILREPRAFLSLVSGVLGEPPELLRLVDKAHPLPATYAPEDLVDLEEYQEELTLTREGLTLRRLILQDLFAMVDAARGEGIELPISSTYRSYDYQAWLFDYWVEELGEEEAQRSSARPGTSQHQLGTTIDFGSITDAFAETEAGLWLADNSWRFGFSLSYPEGYEELTGYKYESWHFRYIGRAAAEMERTFFGGIQQRMLEFWQDQRDELAAAWTGASEEE
jgi:D-alanyl-D-alanine carboxypeptidase